MKKKKRSHKNIPSAVSGVLVGRTDIGGRVGIDALKPDGTPIILGGGEVIINEKSATKYCKELSDINVKGGGVAFDCDLQKVANIDRATGKMPKGEYHKESAAEGKFINRIKVKKDIPHDEIEDFFPSNIYEKGKKIFDFDMAKEFIKKWWNINVVKKLGGGLSGVDYLTDRNSVIKITFNEDEAFFNSRMVGEKLEYNADVYFVENISGTSAFIIEKEFLEELSSKEAEPFVLINFLNRKYIYNKNLFEKFLNEFINAETKKKFTEREKEKMRQSRLNYIAIVNELKMMGLSPDDIGEGNIGFKNNKVACFDCKNEFASGGSIYDRGERPSPKESGEDGNQISHAEPHRSIIKTNFISIKDNVAIIEDPNNKGQTLKVIARENPRDEGVINVWVQNSNEKLMEIKDNAIVKSVFYKTKDGKYQARYVETTGKYNKKGLATAMYDLMDKLGMQTEPSTKEVTGFTQTESGKLFWEKRLANKGQKAESPKSILNQETDLLGRKKYRAMEIDKFLVVDVGRILEKMGAKKLYYSTGEQVGGGSYYLELSNGARIRISDHFVEDFNPYEKRGGKWDGNYVLGFPLDKDGVKSLIEEMQEDYPEIKFDFNLIKKEKSAIGISIIFNNYQRWISEGRMTASDAKTIIESAGLEVPKDILKMAKKEGAEEGTQIGKKSKKKMRDFILQNEEDKKQLNALISDDKYKEQEMQLSQEISKKQEEQNTLIFSGIKDKKLDAIYQCAFTMNYDLLKKISELENINKSPYSCSMYDCHKTWDSTEQGCITITDHFNFYSRGAYHKLTTLPLKKAIENVFPEYIKTYTAEEDDNELGYKKGITYKSLIGKINENDFWYIAKYDENAIPYLESDMAREKGAWIIQNVFQKDYEKQKAINKIGDEIVELSNERYKIISGSPISALQNKINKNSLLISLGYYDYEKYKKDAMRKLKERYNTAFYKLLRLFADGTFTGEVTKREYSGSRRYGFKLISENTYSGKILWKTPSTITIETKDGTFFTGQDYAIKKPEWWEKEKEFSDVSKVYYNLPISDSNFSEIYYTKSKGFVFNQKDLATLPMTDGTEEVPEIEIANETKDIESMDAGIEENKVISETSETFAEGGTIKSKILENAEVLKKFTTHGELYRWAIEHGYNTRAAFPRYKKALLEIGIDYDAIRSGIHKRREEKLQKALTHEVTLYSDAKASHNRFAITDEDGNELWYGRFFESDSDYDGEQSSAELSSAKKAVWFASKIKEAIGADAIRLNLFIDAQWLTYQSHGQKGYVLTQLANRYNIDLNVEWIPGRENPADKWTTESGYKKWSDNDLSSLAIPILEEKEVAEEGTQKGVLLRRNKKLAGGGNIYDNDDQSNLLLNDPYSQRMIELFGGDDDISINYQEGGIIQKDKKFNDVFANIYFTKMALPYNPKQVSFDKFKLFAQNKFNEISNLNNYTILDFDYNRYWERGVNNIDERIRAIYINNKDNKDSFAEQLKKYFNEQRQKLLKEWKDYITIENTAYSQHPFILLIIWEGLTYKMSSQNELLPANLNKAAVAEVVNNLEKGVYPLPVNFYNLYNKTLKKQEVESAKDTVRSYTDNVKGEWLRIPSKSNDPENFEENVIRLQNISANSWCTKTYNAKPYLQDGDFWAFVDSEQKTRVGIRFEGEEIAEIQGEKNDGNIPFLYVEQVKELIKIKKWKISNNIQSEIKDAERRHEEFKKLKEKIKLIKTTEEFFDFLNIKYEKINGNYEISHYSLKIPQNEDILISELGLNDNKFFKNIIKIYEDAYFRGSQVENLGNLQTIGGYAYFENSQIKSLGNLQTIGGSADFSNSQIKSLGNLQTIGGFANFENSQVESLGNLQKIGGYAAFRNSKVESLGNLQTIGRNADFRDSKVESLGNLVKIGGSADFRGSKVESLGNLQTIGGIADFENSQVESLGNLQEIGGNVYFSNSQIKSLGNLVKIGGYADFRGSKVESLGNLQTIEGSAYFENRGDLKREWELKKAKLAGGGNIYAIGKRPSIKESVTLYEEGYISADAKGGEIPKEKDFDNHLKLYTERAKELSKHPAFNYTFYVFEYIKSKPIRNPRYWDEIVPHIKVRVPGYQDDAIKGDYKYYQKQEGFKLYHVFRNGKEIFSNTNAKGGKITENEFLDFFRTADNTQKAQFIKSYFEANGITVDKIIRAKLDDGFFVYHKYGMESKAYKPHKIIKETEYEKIVQTQPYKVRSDFIRDEFMDLGDNEYTVDTIEIPVIEARVRAGIKSDFITIPDFYERFKIENTTNAKGSKISEGSMANGSKINIADIFESAHVSIDKSNIYPLKNFIGKAGFPTKIEFDYIISKSGVDEDKIFYVTGDVINPFAIWDGFNYIGILSFDKKVIDMMQIAEQYKRKQEFFKNAIGKKDYNSVFARTDKKILIPMFIDAYKAIPDNQKYDVFIALYIRSEYGFGKMPNEIIKDVITKRYLSEKYKSRMSALREAIENKKNYDGTITIYRGVGIKSTGEEAALSWSLEKRVAEFFKKRFGGKGGRVISKNIRPEKIIDYLTDRGESEILILPENFSSGGVVPIGIAFWGATASGKGIKIENTNAKGISKEEWIKGQEEVVYRSPHQIDTKTAIPITEISDKTLTTFIDEFKRQYGYPALKSKEINKLKSIIANPEADVVIYRTSPKNELNSGDWVTIDKDYANDIKRQNGGNVYSYTVKASDLFYPKTIEGFKELPSLNKWGAFQYQSSPPPSQLSALYDEADKVAKQAEVKHAPNEKKAKEGIKIQHPIILFDIRKIRILHIDIKELEKQLFTKKHIERGEIWDLKLGAGKFGLIPTPKGYIFTDDEFIHKSPLNEDETIELNLFGVQYDENGNEISVTITPLTEQEFTIKQLLKTTLPETTIGEWSDRIDYNDRIKYNQSILLKTIEDAIMPKEISANAKGIKISEGSLADFYGTHVKILSIFADEGIWKAKIEAPFEGKIDWINLAKDWDTEIVFLSELKPIKKAEEGIKIENAKLYYGDSDGVHEISKEFNNVFVIEADEPTFVLRKAYEGDALAKYIVNNYWHDKWAYSGLYVKHCLFPEYDAVKIENKHLTGLYSKKVEIHDLHINNYYTFDPECANTYISQCKKGDIKSISELLKEISTKTNASDGTKINSLEAMIEDDRKRAENYKKLMMESANNKNEWYFYKRKKEMYEELIKTAASHGTKINPMDKINENFYYLAKGNKILDSGHTYKIVSYDDNGIYITLHSELGVQSDKKFIPFDNLKTSLESKKIAFSDTPFDAQNPQNKNQLFTEIEAIKTSIELSRHENLNKENQERIDTLESDIQRKKEYIDTLESDIHGHKEHIDSLESDIHGHKEQIDSLIDLNKALETMAEGGSMAGGGIDKKNIQLSDFKPGAIYYYSDFYDKSYAIIKAIKIRKVGKGGVFWFTAEIIDNTHLDNKEWNKIGNINSYSNSFVYKSLDDLKEGSEAYNKLQIQALPALLGLRPKETGGSMAGGGAFIGWDGIPFIMDTRLFAVIAGMDLSKEDIMDEAKYALENNEIDEIDYNRIIWYLENVKKMRGGSMAVGGYEGKTAEQIWDDWNESQRLHFITDHTQQQHTPASQIELSKKSYNFLPIILKNELKKHISEGQYAGGGRAELGIMIQKDIRDSLRNRWGDDGFDKFKDYGYFVIKDYNLFLIYNHPKTIMGEKVSFTNSFSTTTAKKIFEINSFEFSDSNELYYYFVKKNDRIIKEGFDNILNEHQIYSVYLVNQNSIENRWTSGGESEGYSMGGETKPYSQKLWDVIETRKSDGTVVRKEENLNTYQAEDVYSKLANTNPVRQGIHNLKMVEVTKSSGGMAGGGRANEDDMAYAIERLAKKSDLDGLATLSNLILGTDYTEDDLKKDDGAAVFDKIKKILYEMPTKELRKIYYELEKEHLLAKGGSMAGGGVDEENYIEYSIIGNEIDEHFDDEDSLREFYDNLSEKEKENVQMFSKEYTNEDGEWVEGEVIIIKERGEKLSSGGSMAGGGEIVGNFEIQDVTPKGEIKKHFEWEKMWNVFEKEIGGMHVGTIIKDDSGYYFMSPRGKISKHKSMEDIKSKLKKFTISSSMSAGGSPNQKEYDKAYKKMYKDLMEHHSSPKEFNKKHKKWIKENAHKYGISYAKGGSMARGMNESDMDLQFDELIESLEDASEFFKELTGYKWDGEGDINERMQKIWDEMTPAEKSIFLKKIKMGEEWGAIPGTSEEGSMAGGGLVKKITKKDKFFHARIKTPKGATTCRTPEGAAAIAKSVSDKAKITTCLYKKDGKEEWALQKVMVKAKGTTKKQAKEIAEKIAAKFIK